MPDDREEMIKLQHQQWLQHPVTQALLNAYNNRKDNFINLVARGSMDISITDSSVRLLAVNVRNTDACIELIKNLEVLLKNQSK